MENNRNDFEIYQNIKINTEEIHNIMRELIPLNNKRNFYIECVIKRIQKCDELYLRELDEELDKVYNIIDDDNFGLKDISRLLKLSNRLTSEVHNLYLENLRKICM